MSYTKGELVSAAMGEIGIAEYEFDITAEEITSGLQKLDAMLANWGARGLHLSYSLPATAKGSDSADPSNIPDTAVEAVITNLAIRIAPGYGKTVPLETRVVAKNSLNTLFGLSTAPNSKPYNNTIKGQGYKDYDRPFFPTVQRTDVQNVDEDIDITGAYSES